MSALIFLKLSSTAHGFFPGTATLKGFENQIQVSSTHHIVEKNPGVRTVSRAALSIAPFVITKKIDKTSPLLFLCWRQGEKITSFKLSYYRPRASGVFAVDYTVELFDAKIARIEQAMVSSEARDLVEREDVSFEFGKMVLRYEDGGYEAEIANNHLT